jgi:hypothetical protein
MGLFDPPAAISADLAEAIVADGDRSRRVIEKAVAKNQAAIPALLEAGEEIAAITRADGVNEILVITNRRPLQLKRGKLNWRAIPLVEVAESQVRFRDLGGGTVKYMLVVETFACRGYAEGDQRR